jgi:hypothetical protein
VGRAHRAEELELISIAPVPPTGLPRLCLVNSPAAGTADFEVILEAHVDGG